MEVDLSEEATQLKRKAEAEEKIPSVREKKHRGHRFACVSALLIVWVMRSSR
jgi:hypothetical protein